MTENDNLAKLRKRMSNLFIGYWKTQTVFAAVKLGVIESLAKGSKTAGEIARERELDERATNSLLWALLSLDLVHYEQDGLTALTELGNLLIKGKKGSMAHASLVWGSEHYNTWQMLFKSIKTGKPAFKQIYGDQFFNWLEMNPDRSIEYHRAMAEYAEIDYQSLLERINLGKLRLVMDVGGGKGVLLANILTAYPETKGILLEQSHLEELAREYLNKKKVIDRCKIVISDFFEPLPVSVDGILLCRVLHDWDDSSAVKILQNCRNALNPNGKMYVVEICVPDKRTSFGALLNLNMLVITGGRERTDKDFKTLFNQSGLELIQTVQLESVNSVLICKSN